MHTVVGMRGGGWVSEVVQRSKFEKGKEEMTGKTRRGLKAFAGLDERRQKGL